MLAPARTVRPADPLSGAVRPARVAPLLERAGTVAQAVRAAQVMRAGGRPRHPIARTTARAGVERDWRPRDHAYPSPASLKG